MDSPDSAASLDKNWIVTGASGFIGREFICHVLTSGSDRMTLLLRAAADGTPPVERLSRQMSAMGFCASQWQQRITVMHADVQQPCLGLSDSDIDRLCQVKNHFVHLAANTQFDAPRAKAVDTNVNGVTHALALAARLYVCDALVVFGYASTAFVHGNRKGLVDVDAPLDAADQRNSYEHSKCLAEQFVRSCREQLPIVIFRPSIVVGDSKTGRAVGSSTVYWALKRYLRGQSRFFACGSARLDIVPVDYVVAAMRYLLTSPASVDQCFPLVAGREGDITLQHLAETAGRYFGLPTPRLIKPDRLLKMGRLLTKVPVAEQVFLKQMLAYLPYFSENPRFDTAPTDAAIADSGIVRPAFDEYAESLMQHCVASQAPRNSTPSTESGVVG